jgi:hypothetical protein
MLRYLNEDGFAEATYLIGERHLIYSNTRDSLGVSFLPGALAAKIDVPSWDDRFCEHVRRVGIGFGAEGRAYLAALLEAFQTAAPASETARYEALRTGTE